MDKNTFAQVKKSSKKDQNIVFWAARGYPRRRVYPISVRLPGFIAKRPICRTPPEYLLSHEFLVAHPDEFPDYIREHLIYEDAKPNNRHYALVRLEQQGKLKAVITQNMDRLHQKLAASMSSEIHGNLTDYYCVGCRQKYTLAQFQSVKKARFAVQNAPKS